MWQAGEGVLYNWVEFIQSGESLDSMGLTVAKDSYVMVQCVSDSWGCNSPMSTYKQVFTPDTSSTRTPPYGLRSVNRIYKVLTDFVHLFHLLEFIQRHKMSSPVLLSHVLLFMRGAILDLCIAEGAVEEFGLR